MTSTDVRRPARMTKRDRRHQLLDVAAEKLVEHGLAAMSMERIAEWAGVSKALPYAHFDNVEALLVALYQREMVRLGREIVAALDAAGPDEDLVEVRVRAWMRATEQRAPILNELTVPGSTVPVAADPTGEGLRYSAGLLYRYHGVDKRQALAVSGILQGALIGASTTRANRLASRKEIERALVRVIHALIDPEPRA